MCCACERNETGCKQCNFDPFDIHHRCCCPISVIGRAFEPQRTSFCCLKVSVEWGVDGNATMMLWADGGGGGERERVTRQS